MKLHGCFWKMMVKSNIIWLRTNTIRHAKRIGVIIFWNLVKMSMFKVVQWWRTTYIPEHILHVRVLYKWILCYLARRTNRFHRTDTWEGQREGRGERGEGEDRDSIVLRLKSNSTQAYKIVRLRKSCTHEMDRRPPLTNQKLTLLFCYFPLIVLWCQRLLMHILFLSIFSQLSTLSPQHAIHWVLWQRVRQGCLLVLVQDNLNI